jgi:small-conductance mechanosensitive channel
MKNTLGIIVIIVVVAGAGIFLAKNKPVQQAKEWMGKVELALEVIDKIEEYTAYSTYKIDMLNEKLQTSDRKIDSLMTLVVSHTSVIDDLEGQIAELPTYKLPELSTVEPEDYKECLQELQGSRQAAEELVSIVEIQRENITLLEAVNTNQQLIIETQKQTISIQRADNRALRDAYEDMIRDANRRKFFGYVVGVLGIAAAIAL